MTREKLVELQAKFLCVVAGLELVDSLDGSPNWWVFNEEAGKIIDDVRKRFPPAPPS